MERKCGQKWYGNVAEKREGRGGAVALVWSARCRAMTPSHVAKLVPLKLRREPEEGADGAGGFFGGGTGAQVTGFIAPQSLPPNPAPLPPSLPPSLPPDPSPVQSNLMPPPRPAV